MSIVLLSTGGGSITINEPNTASNFTQSLPAVTGNIITTGDSGTITQGMLSTAASSIGVSQTWQNLTGSRAIGTTYTNSTGKPIEVIVACTGNGANGLFGVTLNSAVTVFSPSTYGGGVWTSMSFIVPDGNTYTLSQQGANVTLQVWAELR